MKAKLLKPHPILLAGRWAGLTAAGAIVAVLFFLFGGLLHLLWGPISLGPFSSQLGAAINSAVPGLQVRYDTAALQWSRDENRINLVVLGARVFDQQGRIIAQAPKAEIDLAAAPLLDGRVVVRRIALIGVQLTLVHTRAGALRLGIEKDRGQSDLLEDLRKALSKGSGTTSLRSFAVRRARLAFYDERTGLFLVAPEAALQIATPPGKPGDVEVQVDAAVEVSGHRSILRAHLKLPASGDTVTGDLSLKGLDLAAVGTNARALGFLKPYDLSTDLTGSFILDHGSTRLAYADFGLHASGVVGGFGHPVHVKSLRLVARYDGRTGRVIVDDGQLAGNELRAHLSGSGRLAFDPNGSLKSADADLALDKIALNMPGVMQNPVTLNLAQLRAGYTPGDGKITIRALTVESGPLQASFAGLITLADGATPAIAISGHIARLRTAELLHYWPLAAASGARDWIARNISGGTIGPIAVKTDFVAGILDAPVLPETALDISFPLNGSTITYVKGLTPLVGVTGSGTLTGDSFRAAVTSATVTPPKRQPLRLTEGSVVIPNLHLPVVTGEIKAHVEGALPDVLTLIDMPPLNYPTRFHISTESARGQIALNLDFHVPMRRDLSVDALGINIDGKASGVALSIGSRSITNGVASIHIDNGAMRIAGNVDLAGANLDASWDETFKAKGLVTTEISATGTLDEAARNNLGFALGQYVTGPVDVAAKLSGHRGNILTAAVDAVLTPASVNLDVINYRKPAGVPAQMHLGLRMADGAIATGDMTISGPSLKADGKAAFDKTGRLLRLDLPMIHAGPLNDFAAHYTDTPAGGLTLAISGHSADGTGLDRLQPGRHGGQPAERAASERFQVEANLDHLALRDGITLAPFALSVSGAGDRLQTLALTGSLSKTARLSADILNVDGERRLRLQSTDAGLLLKGLFGFTALRGGKLEVVAALSPPPTKAEATKHDAPDYRGEMKITDFSIVDQPFFTRLFSAGSFVGLIDLMGGKGIAVDSLVAPFRMQNGVLDIDNARASGPSIGATASGYFDRNNNKLDLEGALVPIYALNSILGVIPVLGDVLVSKQGEGIFGVSYDVSGKADEPQIAVNPLSMLTPGIFRRIFEGTPKAPVDAQAQASKPPAPQ